MPSKATVCLWFEKDAEAAAKFYTETFPDSAMGTVFRAPGDYPAGQQGDALTVEFTLCGIPYLGLNGGSFDDSKPTNAYSLQVFTDTQEETDRLWDAIVGSGGSAMQCGWCKDKWGFAWQIVPRALMAGMSDPDPAARGRVFQAMMQMVKIDIAAIEAARKG
ncbi:MAG: VOC family protein [Acetobacteraceae bacterium]|nr:VOC family protein [Acetobacteraceae bacterium]